LLRERLRTMLFGPQGEPAVWDRADLPPAYAASGAATAQAPIPNGWERHSHGLEQFFSGIPSQAGLSILDLGEINQAKVSFITDLGHRLYSEDFLHALDSEFVRGSTDGQANPQRITEFLDQTLDFPPHHFDGVLAWDTLEYLGRPLLAKVVERLHSILRPQGSLLALFHSDEKAETLPLYSYRIWDARTLFVSPRGSRPPAQSFNNRSIEKLFQDFHSVKFFLTRDHLREVIVRR